MRIAYIINSTEGGGAAFPVPAITSVFRNAGHEVAVFALTRRDGRAIKPMQDAGLDVRVRDGGRKDHLAALLWLKRQMELWQPTHLWTSLTRATLLGQIIGQMRGIPVASWQHSARLRPPNGTLLRLRRNASCLWVGDSQYVTDITRQQLHIPADRLLCWPIFHARADAPQSRPWQQGEPVRLGSLGRLHPVKGFDTLCLALARLQQAQRIPPFHLTLAGEGEERPALEALIRENGLQEHVSLPGFCENTGQFLADQHLYLQPSHWEGFCMAAHEAMQAGLPVIASAVGELTHSIRNGETGWTVPPKDPDALATALATALAQPEQLADMGQAGREYVLTHFSEEAFTHAGETALRKLAALTT
ncbi:glycosyl transferase family 1 [Acetobacter malorum]|uniref:Glycosyl transferase family 1 n=1 Tax=Acetobacter malorum TaxID=178901 RepID=A0A149UZU6_9PROT|nr:glycosyltransferase [Acetobacter malorum]KXV73540.1 glycosyl transferase family 1 [Acetobacter malorum]